MLAVLDPVPRLGCRLIQFDSAWKHKKNSRSRPLYVRDFTFYSRGLRVLIQCGLFPVWSRSRTEAAHNQAGASGTAQF